MVQRQPDRQANCTILVRTLFLLILFGVATPMPLLTRLWQIQTRGYDKYQGMAVEQQTVNSTVETNWGTIYDRSGETLATSATVYNIQLSPKEIPAYQEVYREKAANAAENGEALDYPEPASELIASNLAQALSLDETNILRRLAKTNSMYETIEWRMEDDERGAMIPFINENYIIDIYTSLTTKHYCPKNSSAARVIGWVSYGEGRDAYGAEVQYDEALSGETGRIVTTKNGDDAQMLYRYEDYYDVTDGDNLTSTLDNAIQSCCKSILKRGIEQFEVQDGGLCIIMDLSTSETLAWANFPTCDPNGPRVVSDPVLNQYLTSVESGAHAKKGIYQEALAEGAPSGEARNKAISAVETKVLYIQWANKAIASTYELGSTFRFIVLAIALGEGVITENSHFYCPGYIMMENWSRPISCPKKAPGHGGQDLVLAVTNSCNPIFVKIGQALGVEKFYDYLEDSGLLERIGIDMQGGTDTGSLIWLREDFDTVQLVTVSFDQQFQVTPIQFVIAASAVINGGHPMQPYMINQVTDGEGNVLQHNEPNGVRQVVSAQTSERCRTILEKTVDGDTGKGTQVEGYRTGGKTDSSETLETDHTIVSFLGFALVDDLQVVILLAYDNPKPAFPSSNITAGGQYIGGSSMTALMAGELLEDTLSHLSVEKTYTANADILVPNLPGLNLADVTSALQKSSLTLRTVDDGGTVTGQIPAAGTSIPGGNQVMPYAGEAVSTDQMQTPSVIGLTAEQVRQKLADVGFYMWATGATEYGSHMVVYEQFTATGALVDRGTIIEVRFTNSTASDTGLQKRADSMGDEVGV